jgi:hypothetical protein
MGAHAPFSMGERDASAITSWPIAMTRSQCSNGIVCSPRRLLAYARIITTMLPTNCDPAAVGAKSGPSSQ